MSPFCPDWSVRHWEVHLDIEPVIPRNRGEVVCPFLARAVDTDEHFCLSESEEAAELTSAYVNSFCLKTRYLTCPRFTRADSRARREARERRVAAEKAARAGAGRRPSPEPETPPVPEPAAPPALEPSAPIHPPQISPQSPTPGEIAAQAAPTAIPAPSGEAPSVRTPDQVPAASTPEEAQRVTPPSPEISSPRRPAEPVAPGPGPGVERAPPAAEETQVLPPSRIRFPAPAPEPTARPAATTEVPASAEELPPSGTRVQRPGRAGAWAVVALAAVLAAATVALEISGGRAPGSSAAQVPPSGTRWSFPAVTGSTSQTVLIFTNRGKATVTVRVGEAGKAPATHSVQVPARSQASLSLPAAERRSALRLTASGPVVVARATVQGRTEVSAYGRRLG